jgi:hypothetical protein
MKSEPYLASVTVVALAWCHACSANVPAKSGLGFTPSNVDLSGIDLTRAGDFIVDNAECTINTDSNLASCGDGGSVLQFKIATQVDGTKVAVYVARSMTIQPGMNLTVNGSLPLVFVVLDKVDIFGTLDANAKFDVVNGGGANIPTTASSTGGGGAGGGGAGSALGAGGGGSYCGLGGVGGVESGPASPSGVAYGSSTITPLVGGSGGGAGAGGAGGGGGAIQLSAGTSITVEASGLIHVGGGGGTFGGISGQEANGGGSGGSILLESPTVTILGTLAANGAGGGAGTSANIPGGEDGTPSATPALGGNAGGGVSAGGNGSGGSVTDGTSGAFTSGNSAGGGGGGAGRIRLNTKPGQALVTGVLSPAMTTPCATEGPLN